MVGIIRETGVVKKSSGIVVNKKMISEVGLLLALTILAFAVISIPRVNPADIQNPVKTEVYTLAKNVPVKLTGNYGDTTSITLTDVYQDRARLSFPDGTADIGPEVVFYQQDIGDKQYIRISLGKTPAAINVKYYDK